MPELTFNAPPTAPVVRITPDEATTRDALTVQFVEPGVDPDGDTLSYTFSWLRDGATMGGVGESVPPDRTRRGELWRVTVVASDGEWSSEPAWADALVHNSPPSAPTLTLGPPAPLASDDLVLDVSAVDHDDDEVVFDITWDVDGTARTDLTGRLGVPAAETRSGQRWTATVTPRDDLDAGPTESIGITVDNTPPTLADITLSPSNPNVQSPLAATAVGLADADGDSTSVHWVWSIDGVVVFEEETTDGRSVLTGGHVRDDAVVVQATPDDGQDLGDPVVSDTLRIGNAPPTAREATITPLSATETTEFTCTGEGGEDADGDVVEFEYWWDISGRSHGPADTLDGSRFHRDDEVYCLAYPTDGTTAGLPVQSDTVTVQNSPPVVSRVTLNPTSPTESSGVTATVVATDDDPSDTIAYTYAWTVGGAPSTATGATLTGADYDRGDAVRVRVTPTDGTDTGAAVSSNSILVANSPPSITSVALDPTRLYTDSSVSAVPSGWSDDDGDAAAYTYAWYVGGVAVSTASSIGGSHIEKGDLVYVEVTPTDGLDAGTMRTSSTHTVQNSAPVAEADILPATSAVQCDEVVLDATASVDKDAADTLSYVWAVTGTPSGSDRTTADLSFGSTSMAGFVPDAAGTFDFRVTVGDGSATSTDTMSLAVSALATNTEPVAEAGDDQTGSGIATCTTTGYGYACDWCEGDTFTLDASGSTDDDGHALTFEWSTSSHYATIDDANAEVTTVEIADLPTDYGIEETQDISILLRVEDCAGGVSEDYLTISFTCEGV